MKILRTGAAAIVLALLAYLTWETRQTSLELIAQRDVMVAQHREATGQLERVEAALALNNWPRWEYRVETPADPVFEEKMTSLGQDGWEIVALRRVEESDLQVVLKGGARMKYEAVMRRRGRVIATGE